MGAHGTSRAATVFREDEGKGWVDCWFTNPGQTEPSHKWTYVKAFKLDGIPGLIGAWFYPDS